LKNSHRRTNSVTFEQIYKAKKLKLGVPKLENTAKKYLTSGSVHI